jgi:outer membrane immunogenic protein
MRFNSASEALMRHAMMLASVSVAALLTMPAGWAADIRTLPRKPAPMSFLPPWSGVYLGLFAGGHWSRDRWTSDNTEPAGEFGPLDLHPRGFSGGALLGANLQQGNSVWGGGA